MNERVRLFGLAIDPVTMPQAVERLLGWLAPVHPECRYVLTPNVDHAVMFQHHTELREAYDDASLVLADGMPLVWAARLLRRVLPARVTGSDLVPALFDAAQARGGLRVFLLGAAPGVAERAATNIAKTWPAVQVVGLYSPPLGFEKVPAQNEVIFARLRDARPDVLIVGLGAPKQELWVHAHRQQIAAPIALCVGATIDFLAGHRSRAPQWMRRTGLEWLHRLAGEPRRLFARYARDAWVFPRLVLREMFGAN